MLKYLGIVVIVFGAACSKGDKCEKAYDKIAPLMKAMEKDSKKDDKDDRAKMVGKCKAELKEHPEREKMIDCILGISGELTMDKMMECSKEEKAERKKDKEESAAGAGAGGAMKAADMIAKRAEFKDQMCACADAACAGKVTEAMSKWDQDLPTDMKDPKLSEEDAKKKAEIDIKMIECMQKATGTATK